MSLYADSYFQVWSVCTKSTTGEVDRVFELLVSLQASACSNMRVTRKLAYEVRIVRCGMMGVGCRTRLWDVRVGCVVWGVG